MFLHNFIYNFIACPGFLDIKLHIKKQQQSKYNQRNVYFLGIVALCLLPISSLGKVVQRLFQTGFFYKKKKKKWSLVTLDRWLSYVVRIIREFAWADTALVILDGWLSDRSSCLSKFNCIGFYLNFLPFCRHLMIQYNLLLYLFADFQQQQ